MCGIAGVLDSRAEPSSRNVEASHRRHETDTLHKEAAKTGGDKPSDTAKRASTADRDERHKDKPSSGVESGVFLAIAPDSLLYCAASESLMYCAASLI